MRKIWLGFIISFTVLVGCNEGTKSGKTIPKDSVIAIAPENIEEQNELSEVITRFARAYANKDNEKANSLIHPDLGLYIIYRPGASDTFVKADSINFSKPIPEYYDYTDLAHDYVLTYGKLPAFDCGTEKWDKLGFICDTTSHPLQLSNIAAFEDEFEEGKFTEDDLEKIEKSELESYRVIITSNNPLIFHVRLYQGKWYVTTLDRAYAGCDA